MAGFGRSKFGAGPFGRSDLGRDLILELFPETYFDDSIPGAEKGRDNENDPLVQLLKAFSHSVNKRRLEIDKIPSLIDYDTAPVDLLRVLGSTLGLKIDKNDPEFIQRTFVSTASQWLQIKGSKRGYRYRGLASGFSVKIENFWRIHESLIDEIPPRYRYYFRPKNVDAPKYVVWNLNSGSNVILCPNGLSPVFLGKEVFGRGIALGTKITHISGATITLDKPASLTGSGVSIGIHRQNKLLYTNSKPGTHRGFAASFNGSRNQITADLVELPSEYSIELRCIFKSTDDQIILKNSPFGVAIDGGRLVFTRGVISISTPIEKDKEYYIACTVGEQERLFVNGVEVFDKHFGFDGASETVGGFGVGGFIGRVYRAETSGGFNISSFSDKAMNGRIWDVRISNRVLSQQEIVNRLRSVRGLVDAGSLLHHWKLNGDTQDHVGGQHGKFLAGESYNLVVEIDDEVTEYIEYFEDPLYSKSAFVRVVFSGNKFVTGVNYSKLLDLVIEKIRDVAAIHHELTPPVYELQATATVGVSAAQIVNEAVQIRAAVSNVFDIVPADLAQTDKIVEVSIRIESMEG